MDEPGRDRTWNPTAANLPLVNSEVDIEGRVWRVLAVQDQDALLDIAEYLPHFPYGFLLWESAVALSRAITADPGLVVGKRVLELGAGVGLPGIVARSLGADVWQTDHQAGALALARQNAEQNGVEGIVQFLADWRDWKHKERYDTVLGADILYERAMHYHLERLFDRCLLPDGCLLLADPGRPQALEFAAHLEKQGWHLTMDTQSVLLEAQGEQNRPVEVALWNLKSR